MLDVIETEKAAELRRLELLGLESAGVWITEGATTTGTQLRDQEVFERFAATVELAKLGGRQQNFSVGWLK